MRDRKSGYSSRGLIAPGRTLSPGYRPPKISIPSRNRDSRAGIGDDSRRLMPSREPSLSRDLNRVRSRDAISRNGTRLQAPSAPSSRGSSEVNPSRLPPELSGGDATRSTPVYRRQPGESGNPTVPSVDSGAFSGSGSSRGILEGLRSNRGVNPEVPGVNSGYGSYSSYSGRRPEHLLPPPPPPISHRLTNKYWRHVSRHFDNYSYHWFGGHHSWHGFINRCSYAPYFWSQYNYVHTYPWVYGYYDPTVYVDCGWYAPRWYGRVYYPWWDWCDAPFVYYYYRYPARFSFGINLGGLGFSYSDYGDYYYDDIDYDYASYGLYGDDSFVLDAVDRPLGVWVPGHWEQQYVVDTEWVWVPGHYTY